MTSTAFDDIIHALHGAVIDAQRLAENQYNDFIQRYFEYKDANSPMQAKTVDIAIRSLHPDAPVDAHDVIQVPLICLAAPSAIKIKELSVEFETELSNLAQVNATGTPAPGSGIPLPVPSPGPAAGSTPGHHVYLDAPTVPSAPGSDSTAKSTTAKVTISFQGTDPPEGVLRINDIMLRRLP